jgi:RNA polymerase sigma-70 factor, ECF subfamily
VLERIADGDREAFAELFESAAPKVKAFLMKRGSSASEADEVAQDVLLTVWRKASGFDSARASAATWIFTIARNKHVDRIRKASRDPIDPRAPEPAPAPTPDQEVFASFDASALRGAMKNLPEDQRVILLGTFFEFRTQADLAADLGVPLGTVKSRTRLGLKKLRTLLTEP